MPESPVGQLLLTESQRRLLGGDIAAAEKEWQAREAELLARIAELEKKIPGVDSGRVAEAMDEKFGV